MTAEVGDYVEVLNAGPRDPLHIEIRPHGYIAASGEHGVMVAHGGRGEGTYGPFPISRIKVLTKNARPEMRRAP